MRPDRSVYVQSWTRAVTHRAVSSVDQTLSAGNLPDKSEKGLAEGAPGLGKPVPMSPRLNRLGPTSLWPWFPHCTSRRRKAKPLSSGHERLSCPTATPCKTGQPTPALWLWSTPIIFEDETCCGLMRSQSAEVGPGCATGGPVTCPAWPLPVRTEPGQRDRTFHISVQCPHQPCLLPFPLLWASSLSGQGQPQVDSGCPKGS